MNKNAQGKDRTSQRKTGKLTPGLGAVSTTLFPGNSHSTGIVKTHRSMTQMGTIRLGKRIEHRVPKIKDFIPLAKLDDLVFGVWDIFEENAYQSAINAGYWTKDCWIDQAGTGKYQTHERGFHGTM